MKHNTKVGKANASHSARSLREEITAQEALEASIAFKRKIATQGAMRDVMSAMHRLGTLIDAPEFNEASCKLAKLL